MSRTARQFIVAAFDFDGTITTRDTLVSFLYHIAGPWLWLKNMIQLLPFILIYLCGLTSRQQTKERVLGKFLDNTPVEQLKAWGESFASSPALQALIKPIAMERLLWHKKQGHRCVLISASIEPYLIPWAKKAGFDDVIASKLQTLSQGTVSGKLQGKNCWGPEKMHRLEEQIGPRENYILYAYGDSKGDRELLAAADYPFFNSMPVEIEGYEALS